MKKILILLVLPLAIACGDDDNNSNANPAPPVTTPPDTTPPEEPGEWKLAWEENFDADLAAWNIWEGGAFNNELQLYKPENLEVKDGYLYINQKTETAEGLENPFSMNNKSFDYTSGRIETITEYGPEDKQDLKNMKISASIQLPQGQGLWGAFWSFNDPWPTKGEIDILEARGGNGKQYQTNFHYGTTANKLSTDPVKNEFKYNSSSSLTDSFHTYEVEWSEDKFVMKFDNEVVKTYASNEFPFVKSFFEKKHRIVLNLAVGGDFFTGLNTADIPETSAMKVDWVRVHTR